MVGHVLDHVVANDQIEFTVRHLGMAGIEGSAQHVGNPAFGSLRSQRVWFNGPVVGCMGQMFGEMSFSTPDFKDILICGGQKTLDVATLKTKICRI